MQSLPAVALDLDGVLWHGTAPIAGSAEATNAMMDAGYPLVFVTNNSFTPIADQESKLASFGVADVSGRVISSAMAAASLVSEGERVVVLGGEGIVEALHARGAVVVPAGPADAVVVGLDFNLSFERLQRAVSAIRDGARYIATNTDPTYPTENGLFPGGGSIVAAVTTASETDPIVAGKPEQPVADLVRQRLGPDGIGIGDRPDTDGLFATRAGYRFGLVLSGVTTREQLPGLVNGGLPEPDITAEDLRSLVTDEFGLSVS